MDKLIRFFGDIHTIAECMKVLASMNKKMAVIEKDVPLRASCAQEPGLFDAEHEEPEREEPVQVEEKPRISGGKGRPRRDGIVMATYIIKDHGYTQKQQVRAANLLGIEPIVGKGYHPGWKPEDGKRIVAELDKMQRKRQEENTE